MRVLWLFYGLLACLSAPLQAKPHQHGNVIFTLPTGWQPGRTDDSGTLTLRPDLPEDECRFCLIHVTVGLTDPATPEDTLATQSLRFVDTDGPAPEVLSPPDPTDMNGLPAATMAQVAGDRLQILVAVQLSDQSQLFAFIGSAGDEAELAESLAVFQRDFVPMLDTALYVSEGAEPLLPPPEPGPLAGLYWGFSTGWVMQIDGTMQMEMDHRHLIFWPDGRFHDGTPPQGLQTLDPQTLLAAGNMSWGNYRATDGKLTLTFATGEVEEIGLAEDNALQDGDRSMYPVVTLADGSPLDGSLYRMSFSGFSPGGGVTGGVTSSNLTVFNPDGTWTGDNSGGAFGNFEVAGDTTGGFVTGSENQVSGTYTVKDGLLIRSFDDGRPPRTDLIYQVAGDIFIGTLILEPAG